MELLALYDYRVVAAASGEEALASRAGTPPDLLLTDLVLPGMSGLQLAVRLRESYPQLAVILMSGYDLGERAEQLVAGKMVHFLAKPFGIRDLATCLGSALGRRGPL